MRFLLIALGGAVGALARYAIATGTQRATGAAFPVGTLLVNAIGCLVIGFLWVVLEERLVSAEARAFIFVGGLGAFTTFSTYGLETVQLARDGELGLAALNVVASNALGIAFVAAGAALGKAFAGG